MVAERCRADSGEECAIDLISGISSKGISEKALTREMTREVARKHSGGASTQVYCMLLHPDKAGKFHCRLCAVDANEGGWKKA